MSVRMSSPSQMEGLMNTMEILELAELALMRACIELELVDEPIEGVATASRAVVRYLVLSNVRAALDALNGR
jgi:hypothetical protein